MSDKPIKLLLVEDNLGDVRVLRGTIAEAHTAGFALTHVERLSEALQRLQEERFDIIFLDLSLPDSRGLPTLTRVYAQAPQVPIIVLTGLDDEEIAIKALQEGAQDYINKERLESGLLARAIRYAIERQRVLQELQAAEERYRHLFENAKALEQQRSEFLALLTHDIKNPLTVILGHADLLLEEAKEQGVEDKEREDSLLWMKSSALTVLSLVENYLDLSRLEEGQRTLAQVPVRLNELLGRVRQQYKAEAQQRRIALELDLQKELPVIAGDSLALERVFANLISNALKFTPAGGIITISSASHQGEAVTTVADNGPGIAPEELPFIFDKYRRTASAGQRKGTGLGLFIVKTLVEAHSGRVEVQSALGQGTCFSVFLPIAS